MTPDFIYPASCLLINGWVGYLGSGLSLFAFCVGLFAALNAPMQQNFSLAYRLVVCMRRDDWKGHFLNKKTVFVVQFFINGYILALILQLYTTFLSDEVCAESESSRKHTQIAITRTGDKIQYPKTRSLF